VIPARHTMALVSMLLVSASVSASGKRPSVLVNPHGQGNGTPRTIAEGIVMVEDGGKVMVLPGTYPEALVIDRPLTLEAIADHSGAAILEPPTGPAIAVEVKTSAPVVIRGFTLRYGNAFGIRGEGSVDITVEGVTIVAVAPPLGVGALVSVANEGPLPGPNGPPVARARLAVRDSDLDGSIGCDTWPGACTGASLTFPQTFGVSARGDVDTVVERNVIRRAGGACVFVQVRTDLQGETNAQIFDNDLDQCYPAGRAGAIFVAPQGTNNPSVPYAQCPKAGAMCARGIVEIVGNRIRNTERSCVTTTGINFIALSGRIERNRLEGVVQTCAASTLRALPSAIWLGSRNLSALFPPVDVQVRFNDISGNAQAGLRLAPNMKAVLDARCNWWNDATGPSGVGPGTGDALIVESGATTPLFTPWAEEPFADGQSSCSGVR
jgi:hypothetical protein